MNHNELNLGSTIGESKLTCYSVMRHFQARKKTIEIFILMENRARCEQNAGEKKIEVVLLVWR